MRFEHEGMALSYDTPDAPGPGEAVQAGTEVTLTVGVQPIDASNKVEVLYRMDHGPTEVVAAKWLFNDTSRKTQYFRASLPAFRAGNTVEYTAICRCAGRQVPSPEEAQQFASSFRVVGIEDAATLGLPSREATMVGSGTAIGAREDTRLPMSATSSGLTPASQQLQEAVSGEPAMNETQNTVTYRVVGRVLNQETGMPLAGFTVRGFDLDSEANPQDLGYATTNSNGLFTLVYAMPRQSSQERMAEDNRGRRVRLHVLDTQAREIHQSEVRVTFRPI
jgi:hypothetical protein